MITTEGGDPAVQRPGAGLVTSLHQAAHVTLHLLAARLAGLGLTASEQNVLAVLADGHSRAVGELARDTGTRPTTLTSVLDRLERRGYLARQLDRADRRSFLIVLTGSGRGAAARVQAAVAEVEADVLSRVSPAELAGFLAVARALTRAQVREDSR